jgi:hypothetical protein
MEVAAPTGLDWNQLSGFLRLMGELAAARLAHALELPDYGCIGMR